MVRSLGSDDIFKKRKKEHAQRKHGYKTPKANSFLIVTEGERTEPLYFGGLTKLIRETIGGTVEVVSIPHIEIHGEGCGTGKLVEKTDEIVNKAKFMFQNVWIVFDKDDFNDFDEAIHLAHDKGYCVAWSNQSFEYWLYLHFAYSDSALHRKVWLDKLSEQFRAYQLADGRYEKNYENIYELMDSYGGVATAVKHAKRRMVDFDPKQCKPSAYDPGTTVHLLVDALQQYLNEDNLM